MMNMAAYIPLTAAWRERRHADAVTGALDRRHYQDAAVALIDFARAHPRSPMLADLIPQTLKTIAGNGLESDMVRAIDTAVTIDRLGIIVSVRNAVRKEIMALAHKAAEQRLLDPAVQAFQHLIQPSVYNAHPDLAREALDLAIGMMSDMARRDHGRAAGFFLSLEDHWVPSLWQDRAADLLTLRAELARRALDEGEADVAAPLLNCALNVEDRRDSRIAVMRAELAERAADGGDYNTAAHFIADHNSSAEESFTGHLKLAQTARTQDRNAQALTILTRVCKDAYMAIALSQMKRSPLPMLPLDGCVRLGLECATDLTVSIDDPEEASHIARFVQSLFKLDLPFLSDDTRLAIARASVFLAEAHDRTMSVASSEDCEQDMSFAHRAIVLWGMAGRCKTDESMDCRASERIRAVYEDARANLEDVYAGCQFISSEPMTRSIVAEVLVDRAACYLNVMSAASCMQELIGAADSVSAINKEMDELVERAPDTMKEYGLVPALLSDLRRDSRILYPRPRDSRVSPSPPSVPNHPSLQ